MKTPITTRPWFKTKQYGWGWYPSSWQGWLVLFLWGVAVVANAFRINDFNTNPSALTEFLIETLVLSLLLLAVSYLTGEKPGWHWGDRANKTDKAKPEGK